MNPLIPNSRIIRVAPLLFATFLVPLSVQSFDGPPATTTPRSGATTLPEAAAGAVEDTLQACMARIPKDASIGQRMIAEQSCRRDETERKPYEAIPGARTIQHRR
jgi:hypothetical protein